MKIETNSEIDKDTNLSVQKIKMNTSKSKGEFVATFGPAFPVKKMRI